MQATLDTSSNTNVTSNAQNIGENADLKGAQFVVQSNLKVMARAVATLSKLSEDMLIEVSESGLLFRAFNRSRSSQCLFRFSPQFFNDVDVSLINTKVTNVCRMSMKAAQSVFRGVHFSDKNFVTCEFRIDPRSETMGVKLTLNYDVTRTLHVKLLEYSGSLLKPIHDRNDLRNKTVIFASVLSPILSQMKNDCELTLIAKHDSLRIKNFSQSETPLNLNTTEVRKSKKVRTETNISVENITKHEVRFPVELSFPLREFMAIIVFAEQLSSEVCLYYDIPGRPLIVSIEAHSNFEIELMIATTSDDENFEVDGALFTEMTLDNYSSQDQPIRKRGKRVNRQSSDEPQPEDDEILVEHTGPTSVSTNQTRRLEGPREEREISGEPEMQRLEIDDKEEGDERANQSRIAANNSWRQHEVTQSEKGGGEGEEEEGNNDMEIVEGPQENYQEEPYQEPMAMEMREEEEVIQEGFVENCGNGQEATLNRTEVKLEKGSSRVSENLGDTPPPDDVHFAVPEMKRRKTVEVCQRGVKLSNNCNENDKRNRKVGFFLNFR